MDEAAVVAAFLRRYMDDRDAGRVPALADYRSAFPGYETTIEREFAALAEVGVAPLGRDDGATPESIGPYRLLRELARGAQGEVHLAVDPRLGRKVALKVLRNLGPLSGEFLRRFRREAAVAARLEHPGICAIHDTGLAGGTAWIAMRYVEGQSLGELIAEERCRGDEGDAVRRSRDRIDRAILLGERVARALHAAHEAGIVHRDVKPGNIMVGTYGEPVVVDFGLARDAQEQGASLTRTGQMFGTPAYMSPEQIVPDDRPIDRRTDVYSLGVTLYELLTLEHPFQRPTLDAMWHAIRSTDPADPRSHDPRIPRDLAVVVATAMEKDRDRRYATAAEFAADLQRVREHEPIRARPAGRILRVRRWAERHTALAVALGGILVSLSGGLAVSIHLLGVARTEGEGKSAALESAGIAARRREEALDDARAYGLRAAAEAARATDPTLALLLAREAVRTAPGRESTDTLRFALAGCLERARFAKHRGPVLSAAWSPGGERVLTLGHDMTAWVWDPSGRPLHVLRARLGHVAWSPRGDRVLGSCETRGVVWDPETESKTWLAGHEATVVQGAWSPNGKLVATASEDRTARIWDASGRTVAVLVGHAAPLSSIAFSPDGRHVLTSSRGDFTARLWDLEGHQEASLAANDIGSESAAFSPAGDRIVTWCAGSGHPVRIWRIDGTEEAVLRDAGFGSSVTDACFSAAGDGVLIAYYATRTVCLRDLSGRVISVCHASDSPVRRIAVSPDGNRIAGATDAGSVHVWDSRGRQIAHLVGHTELIHSVRFAPDGESIVTASSDRTSRVWRLRPSEPAEFRAHPYDTTPSIDCLPTGCRVVVANGCAARILTATGAELTRLDHGTPVTAVAVSPRGDRIVTAGPGGIVRLWRSDGASVLDLRGHDAGSTVASATFVQGSDRLVTGSYDGKVIVWDFEGRALTTMKAHNALTAVASAPDGRCIATAAWGIVTLWSGEGEELVRLPPQRGELHPPVEFSASGERVSACGSEWTAGVWSADGRMLWQSRRHGARVACARLDPDGGRLLTASHDCIARLHFEDGRPSVTFDGHTKPLRDVRFSPSGTRVVTASSDGTARVWSAGGGRLATLRADGSDVLTARFSPSENHVITVSADGFARVWTLDEAEVLQRAESHSIRKLTRAERERYRDLLGPENEARLAAESYVEPLLDSLVLRSDVAERVRGVTDLDPSVREQALALLGEEPDDVAALGVRAWGFASGAGKDPEEYRRAIRIARAALRLAPDALNIVTTLGVALYRAGDYRESVETLERAAAAKTEPVMEDFAYLAMAYERLGRHDDAVRSLARMRDVFASRPTGNDGDRQGFVREVEGVVGVSRDPPTAR